MDKRFLKDFLEEKYIRYNQTSFIDNDPIFVAHQFSKKEDIEIAGFLTAMLAWGQRKTIINKGIQLMQMMDNSPYEFLSNSDENDFKHFRNFKHRTFTGEDCIYFIKALKNIYSQYGGIGNFINSEYHLTESIKETLINFRRIFFSLSPPNRVYKHIADVGAGAGGKRLNMYLRWMVRNAGPVDFGLWNSIPPAALYIPLDLHTGNVSRKLGLLQRTQNDWNAVEQLTEKLIEFDPLDPVKYDFALFGLGIYEDF